LNFSTVVYNSHTIWSVIVFHGVRMFNNLGQLIKYDDIICLIFQCNQIQLESNRSKWLYYFKYGVFGVVQTV